MVPSNSTALLGIIDVEVLDILRITGEIVEGEHAGKEFDSQMA